jgi:hypothetical protein
MLLFNYIGHMAVEAKDQSMKRQNIFPKQILFTPGKRNLSMAVCKANKRNHLRSALVRSNGLILYNGLHPF